MAAKITPTDILVAVAAKEPIFGLIEQYRDQEVKAALAAARLLEVPVTIRCEFCGGKLTVGVTVVGESRA